MRLRAARSHLTVFSNAYPAPALLQNDLLE